MTPRQERLERRGLRMMAMRAEGWSDKEIAAEFGCHRTTVIWWRAFFRTGKSRTVRGRLVAGGAGL